MVSRRPFTELETPIPTVKAFKLKDHRYFIRSNKNLNEIFIFPFEVLGSYTSLFYLFILKNYISTWMICQIQKFSQYVHSL